jgi:hypothetical protein
MNSPNSWHGSLKLEGRPRAASYSKFLLSNGLNQLIALVAAKSLKFLHF